MRTVNREITYTKQITVTEIIVKEDIIEKTERKEHKYVGVTVGCFNGNEEKISEYFVEITGENYDLLMSQDSMFRSDKPLNDYLVEDIYPVIDKVRTII